ncbi:M15 family metallopeptidase [Listeria rocourtiae]|uniref:M15 family metallopeptidase n=1 Tax=Listeria rocourtiae TaxID=647910 RepID=UPI0003E87D76|nr:L-alanoyl-D-glutamate peptidase [Listeria rocourtiae FSL F6-920]
MGKLHYSDRSWGNIAKLANDTKAKATALFKYAEDNNIEVLIYETIRTKAQQEANVASGASQTMKSYHLVGQALDFVPTKGSATKWDEYGRADIKKFIAKAKALGFEWGGDWTSFVDKPHLQNNYKGYGTDTLGNTVSKPQPAPSKPPTGGSIVDYLNSKKIDSSMANRKKNSD